MLIEIDLFLSANGDKELFIDCYSYQINEFDSIYFVLKKSTVEYAEYKLPPDKSNRIGFRFSLIGESIQKLESYLKISFFAAEITGSGQPYKCERVSVLDSATGCKTIYADNDHSANVICAIVARKQNWFDGLARQGVCKK